MGSDAKGSPKTRGVLDLEQRVSRLAQLEATLELKPTDLASFVEPELWQTYWHRLDEIERLMFAAQKDAERINLQICQGMAALSPIG